MITPFQMYFIVMAGDFKVAILTLGTVGIILSLFSVGLYADSRRAGSKRFNKWVWMFPVIFLLMTIMGAIIPTTKQIAAIYLVPKIVNNQRAQELPGKILKLGEDWIEELKPKAKGEK